MQYLKNNIFTGIMGKDEFLKINKVIKRSNVALIAILDPDMEIHSNDIIHGYADVLQIKFWDLEFPVDNLKVITDLQGIEIYKFIVKNSINKFLIHCSAGISRSAGVAMAVECIVKNGGNLFEYKLSPSAIVNFGRYHPNYTVFDAIIK
jgi:predicted protein tyrosine phosphatase